jgi:hypothetical protein
MKAVTSKISTNGVPFFVKQAGATKSQHISITYIIRTKIDFFPPKASVFDKKKIENINLTVIFLYKK